jgi:hypothetical protein
MLLYAFKCQVIWSMSERVLQRSEPLGVYYTAELQRSVPQGRYCCHTLPESSMQTLSCFETPVS